MGTRAQKALSEYCLMMITSCQIKLNILHDVDADKLIKRLCNSVKDLDLSTAVLSCRILDKNENT